MTYEEYEKKITGIVTNPDSAPTAAQELLGDIRADLDTLTSAQESLASRDEQIRSLQDTNTKLFLQVTGNSDSAEADPEDWTELEGDEALEAFLEAHKEE